MTESLNETILLVDKNEKARAAVCERFGDDYDITMSEGSEEALKILADSGPFAVVVADYRLRDMDRNVFLKRVRAIDPCTVRILLTSGRNHELAVQTINKNEVFRFLKTPCSERSFSCVLNAAVQQYQMRLAEKERPRVDIMGFVNHELQAPVACIRACAETLINCNEVNADIQDEFLSTILSEAERLAELVPKLLETVKTALSDVVLEPSQIELAEAIQAIHSSPEEVEPR